jgi:tRNA (cmo5U34)-methyltransferase
MSLSRFDRAAASWDEHPGRIRMARSITAAVLAQIPVQPAMTAIDYGCGTGLVTLALQPSVERIIGIDSSSAMLSQLREKVAALGYTHVETRQLDLTTERPPADLAADLIVSAMVLHHVADIPRLLRSLTDLLRPGGYLALADLDQEDGSFHADQTGVHHFGVDRDALLAQLAVLGFTRLHAVTAYVQERPGEHGPKQYPIFLISGQRAEACHARGAR